MLNSKLLFGTSPKNHPKQSRPTHSDCPVRRAGHNLARVELQAEHRVGVAPQRAGAQARVHVPDLERAVVGAADQDAAPHLQTPHRVVVAQKSPAARHPRPVQPIARQVPRLGHK